MLGSAGFVYLCWFRCSWALLVLFTSAGFVAVGLCCFFTSVGFIGVGLCWFCLPLLVVLVCLPHGRSAGLVGVELMAWSYCWVGLLGVELMAWFARC